MDPADWEVVAQMLCKYTMICEKAQGSRIQIAGSALLQLLDQIKQSGLADDSKTTFPEIEAAVAQYLGSITSARLSTGGVFESFGNLVAGLHRVRTTVLE